jgi:phenylalanyl-tRNA synthetase beta subunit
MCELVEFLYSYRGKPLADDQQSLTYRVTLNSPDRTLSNEDATAVRASIIDALRAAGHELRV